MTFDLNLDEFKEDLKKELLDGIKNLFPENNKHEPKYWKSTRIQEYFDIDEKTLKKWRIKGIIPYTTFTGCKTIFYDIAEIEAILEKNRTCNNFNKQ